MNFAKSIHTALWGSESWEIFGHPSDPSVIVDGERKGATLREVYPNFPLPFKVIDRIYINPLVASLSHSAASLARWLFSGIAPRAAPCVHFASLVRSTFGLRGFPPLRFGASPRPVLAFALHSPHSAVRFALRHSHPSTLRLASPTLAPVEKRIKEGKVRPSAE